MSKSSDSRRRQILRLRREHVELRKQLAGFSQLQQLCREQQATIERQQAIIAQQQATIEKQQATIEHLLTQQERFQEQIALLKKALFASRRERHVPSPDQKLLFAPESFAADSDKNEQDASSDESREEEPPPAALRRKKRRPRFEFPQCLPRRRIEHPLPETERTCSCGCQREVLHERVTKQLELIPASAYVAEHVQFTYRCPQCRDGAALVRSPKPATANDKGIFGPSVIAYLAEAKFGRHQPLYRLQEQLNRSPACGFRAANCAAHWSAALRVCGRCAI